MYVMFARGDENDLSLVASGVLVHMAMRMNDDNFVIDDNDKLLDAKFVVKMLLDVSSKTKTTRIVKALDELVAKDCIRIIKLDEYDHHVIQINPDIAYNSDGSEFDDEDTQCLEL